MKVRVWYSQIERSDENSSVLLVGGKRVELPNDAFKTGARNSVILEKSIAEKHGSGGSCFSTFRRKSLPSTTRFA